MAKPSVDHILAGGFVQIIGRVTMKQPEALALDDIFERRSKGRTTINRGALLFFTGQPDVFSCCVRDVTNSGAGIRLDGLNIVPAEFGISFDRFRTMRMCRLIWRDGDFLGVIMARLTDV